MTLMFAPCLRDIKVTMPSKVVRRVGLGSDGTHGGANKTGRAITWVVALRLKRFSIATVVSQGETLMSTSLLFCLGFKAGYSSP